MRDCPKPDRTVSSPAPAASMTPLQWCLLGLALVAVQALLIANPGYFSHDELQWAAFADVPDGASLPWVGWFDVATFQYRPLTFNAWLLLSQALFERPRLFHAVWVLLGSVNGLLLARLLCAGGQGVRVAAFAAVVFVLNPYAAYVHGWVATLADLLWVGIGLAAACWLQARPRVRDPHAGLVSFAATALALLAKEAAVVLPALAVLAAALQPSHRRRWAWAAAGSAAAVAAYLALRLGPVFDGARPGTAYGWHLLNVPRRWAEYPMFLLGVPHLLEMQSLVLASWPRLLSALVLPVLVLAVLVRAGGRWAIAWLAGGAAALGPVLILDQSANQYGYGFSAVCVLVAARAWPAAGRLGRVVLLAAAGMAVVHGVHIQHQLLQAGQRQARFSPALAGALRAHAGPRPLVLHVPAPHERWLYGRLIHAIPRYAGVPMGERVRLGETDADYLVLPDGRLQPVPAGTP